LLFFKVARNAEEGETKAGGVIIIGPIPVVFGTDKETTKTVLILSLAFTIVLAIMTVVLYVISR
jgi:uncharacterized protein (TIGR00304 family)